MKYDVIGVVTFVIPLGDKQYKFFPPHPEIAKEFLKWKQEIEKEKDENYCGAV